MRPFLALLLSLSILGAVGGYLRAARALQEREASQRESAEQQSAEGRFAVEVTLTFSAGGENAFALEPTQSTAVLVRFRGRDVLRVDQPVAAGSPLRVDDVPEISAGANEFFVEAQPSAESLAAPHAVRVRVLRDDIPLADQVLWSDAGLPVRGTVRVDVPQMAISEHEN